MRDWLMSCCHWWWWWGLQGLDLNMLGQCLFEEAMMMMMLFLMMMMVKKKLIRKLILDIKVAKQKIKQRDVTVLLLLFLVH